MRTTRRLGSFLSTEVRTSDTYREVLSRGRPLRGGSLSAEEPVELRRVDAHWSSATMVTGRCLPLQKVVKGLSGRYRSALAKTTFQTGAYV